LIEARIQSPILSPASKTSVPNCAPAQKPFPAPVNTIARAPFLHRLIERAHEIVEKDAPERVVLFRIVERYNR
jgi:hypothetical protein